MSLNLSRTVSTQMSTSISTATSGALAVDAPESTAISTAMSTAAAEGVVSTADSTVKAYALSVSNVALSAASSGVVADSKAESASVRASSVSVSAATAASVASSMTLSLNTTGKARNLGNKNVGSVQNSDANLRISTAGDYVVNNVVYTKAASSAVFAFPASTLSSSQAIALLATLDSAGTGTVTAGALADSGATVLPATPAGGCPVARIDIACGTSSIVLGTTTFSQITSSGGSTVITQLAGVN